MVFVFIEILFKMLLFKGGVLIYTEHCKFVWLGGSCVIVRRIQIAVPDASENLGAAYVQRLSVQRNRIPCASVPQISAMNLDA